jgi:hypothetical protein
VQGNMHCTFGFGSFQISGESQTKLDELEFWSSPSPSRSDESGPITKGCVKTVPSGIVVSLGSG